MNSDMGSWKTLPQYQRAQQRVMTLGPEDKAVWATLNIDGPFGDQAMRKNMMYSDMGQAKKDRDRNFNLKKQVATHRHGLGERWARRNRKQDRRANKWAMANVGLGTIMANRKRKIDNQTLAELRRQNALFERHLGIPNKRYYSSGPMRDRGGYYGG
jgi:hypothetical protein